MVQPDGCKPGNIVKRYHRVFYIYSWFRQSHYHGVNVFTLSRKLFSAFCDGHIRRKSVSKTDYCAGIHDLYRIHEDNTTISLK